MVLESLELSREHKQMELKPTKEAGRHPVSGYQRGHTPSLSHTHTHTVFVCFLMIGINHD